MQMRCKEP